MAGRMYFVNGVLHQETGERSIFVDATLVQESTSTTSAAITGTATATINEDDITTGGKTIIVTLTGDTFKAAGTGPIGSTADTQALIDGFDAASSPTNGWNNEVRDKALTSEIVRTSSTVATWTIAAQAGYDISSQETITGTIPTDVLVTGAGALTATPTFTVDLVSAGSTLVIDSGSYSTTGTTTPLRADFNITSLSGAYSITGTDIILIDPPTGFTLVIDSGSYSYTGTELLLKAEFNVINETGLYSITGTETPIFASFNIQNDAGSYTTTGTSINLPFVGNMTIEAGSYIINGTDLNLIDSGNIWTDLTPTTTTWTDESGASTTWTDTPDSSTIWTDL